MAAFLIGLFTGVVLVAVVGCWCRKSEAAWEKSLGNCTQDRDAE